MSVQKSFTQVTNAKHRKMVKKMNKKVKQKKKVEVRDERVCIVTVMDCGDWYRDLNELEFVM